MAKKPSSAEPLPPVVEGVLEDFLKRISEDASLGQSVSNRLRTMLLENQETTADALRIALFSEEPLP